MGGSIWYIIQVCLNSQRLFRKSYNREVQILNFFKNFLWRRRRLYFLFIIMETFQLSRFRNDLSEVSQTTYFDVALYSLVEKHMKLWYWVCFSLSIRRGGHLNTVCFKFLLHWKVYFLLKGLSVLAFSLNEKSHEGWRSFLFLVFFFQWVFSEGSILVHK